jgi:hypothetical protein
MSKTNGLAGALVLGITAVVGCSSSGSDGAGGGSSVDFAALRAQYTSPTGALVASNVLQVGSGLAQQESQTSGIPTATASAKTHIEAARRGVPRTMDSPVTCSAVTASGVSCTCGGGGTFNETFSGEGSQTGVEEGTFDYDDCNFDDSGSATTDTVNGTMSFADYSTAPVMEIFSGSLSETITPPGTTTTEKFNYALVGGQLTYSITIASGTVLVSDDGSWDESTQSGSFTVTDKSGTWSCNITNGTGTCTGSSGTINI